MNEEPIVYEGKVLDEWIDYNGHMNDAAYVRVFSESIDNLMDHLGIDAAFRAHEQVSIYTLQTAVHYLNEISLGASFVVTARLLECDSKKLRVFITMLDSTGADRLSTMEALLLHMDMNIRRSCAFRAPTLEKIESMLAAQREYPWPREAGNGIALQRKR